jgi:hypothetical protein
MRFKSLLIAGGFVAALVGGTSSCEETPVTTMNLGSRVDNENEFREAFFGSAAMAKYDGEGHVVGIDPSIGRLQYFDVSPLRLVRSVSNPLRDERQAVFTDASLGYSVVVSRHHFAIVRHRGSNETDPVELEGMIRGAAFDPTSGALALWDDAGHIALVTMDSHGQITGAKVRDIPVAGNPLTAATVLNDGRLVMAMGESTIKVADIAASIRDAAWSISATFTVTSNSLAARSLAWMAPIPGDPNLVMALDAQRVLTIDVDAQTATAKDMAGYTVLRAGVEGQPHVVAQTPAQAQSRQVEIVTWSVGLLAFETQVVPYGGADLIASSVSVATDKIALIGYTEDGVDENTPWGFGGRELTLAEWETGAVVAAREIGGPVAIVPTSGSLFLRYASPLGYVRRESWEDEPSSTSLKGFNLSLYR